MQALKNFDVAFIAKIFIFCNGRACLVHSAKMIFIESVVYNP